MPRKVICYIATSADGYIARADGDTDWLHRYASSHEQYGYKEFVAGIDTIVWGRKTWDQAQTFVTSGEAGTSSATHIFTTHPEARAARADAEFVNAPVEPFMQRLRTVPGKDIWMMGGGGIIAAFLDAGELDEFIIHVIPVMIGEGIPLVAPRHREIPLRLQNTKPYDDGVVMLHYGVGK